MDETKDKRTVLGETRKYIQWNFLNGDNVTWGSDDILKPYMTVAKLESFAQGIANPLESKILILENQVKNLEKKIQALNNVVALKNWISEQ